MVRLSLAVGLFIPLSAEAQAPVYFDLGGLIIYSALYLIGLMAFMFVMGFTEDNAARKFCSWLLAAYIIGPAIFIFVAVGLQSMHNERRMEELKIGEQRNIEAFGNYCKGRTRIVHTRAPHQDGASLAVRIEKNFTGIYHEFNADPLFGYLRDNRDLCTRIGVTVLEGVYDGAYSKENGGYEREVRRYAMCTKDKWTVIPEIQSRYELVLGQIGHKDPVPWGGEGGRWMSNSSIQIIDRLTGNVLAEDTMYFLRKDTGEGGCPAGMEQLSKLLADVFGRQ